MRETRIRLGLVKSRPRDEGIRRRDSSADVVHKTPSVSTQRGDAMPANKNDTIRYGLALADPEGLDRWREAAEADERERRRERERAAHADTAAQLRAEIAALREEMAAQREVTHEAVGQVLGTFADEAANSTEKAIRQIQSEFMIALERRFAELNARVNVLMLMMGDDAKPRSERTLMDLPNPFAPRRVVY